MTESPPELLEAIEWLLEPEGSWRRGAPSYTNWSLRGFPSGFARRFEEQPWAQKSYAVSELSAVPAYYMFTSDSESTIDWLLAERVITEEERQLLLVNLTLGLSNGF
jgi:hypothetical protein